MAVCTTACQRLALSGQTCRPNGEVPNSTVLTCGSLTCRRTSQEIAWVVAESKTTTSFISPTCAVRGSCPTTSAAVCLGARHDRPAFTQAAIFLRPANRRPGSPSSPSGSACASRGRRAIGTRTVPCTETATVPASATSKATSKP